MGTMMTIGEFAERTGLTISALRFYADRGLLPAAQVDPTTGYRRYRHEQITDGVLIRNLRLLDMPLTRIGEALEQSEADRSSLIDEHIAHLEHLVERARTVALTMGVQPDEQEPTMPTTPAPSAALPSLDLARALDQVLPAAGQDPELPHLMGVLIEARTGSIRLAATDSHRLAIRDLVPSRLDQDFRAVVPAATLARWRRSLDDRHELSLDLDERTVRLRGEGVDLQGRVMTTTFPPYEQLLTPAGPRSTMVVDRQELLSALGHFDDSGAVLLSSSVDRLRLIRREITHETAATCDRAGIDVAVNPLFAAEAASSAVGPEVVLEVEDAGAPIVFRSADDGTYTSLLMPVLLE